jgi:spermidine synthase
MVSAAREAGATVINSTFHHFSPFGVSGVVVIQESHLAVHTWPEYQYAAVDLFTCGEPVDPWLSYTYLSKAFQSDHGSTMEIRRGQLQLLEQHKISYPGVTKQSAQDKVIPVTTRNIWFTERDNNIALSLRHKGDPLFRKKSDYQHVEVYDTYEYGKMLTCDGIIMCAEEDEHVYHEMIAHVPVLTHPNPKRVLVIGGGDGGTIRELCKYEHIEKIIQVEIDALVIEASKQYLPSLASAYDNPKVEVHIADGIQYAADAADESFDIVIIDSTDPVGPAEGLFTEGFYTFVRRILKSQGIMVTQSESPRYNVDIFKQIYATFHKVFGKNHVFPYLAYIPTYPTGMWSFSYCTLGDIHPLTDLDDSRAGTFSEDHNLRYYSPAVHRAAFALPKFVREMIAEPHETD